MSRSNKADLPQASEEEREPQAKRRSVFTQIKQRSRERGDLHNRRYQRCLVARRVCDRRRVGKFASVAGVGPHACRYRVARKE